MHDGLHHSVHRVWFESNNPLVGCMKESLPRQLSAWLYGARNLNARRFELHRVPFAASSTMTVRRYATSKSHEDGARPSATPKLQIKQPAFKRFLHVLGPGVVTGASDDDPSGIGTYTMAGATFGYATLWMALVTLPMMATVQFICAKIGLVYGCGLAGVMRRHYPRSLLYMAVLALMIANTINAAADLAAIAAGVNLLVPVPTAYLLLPIALLILILQVWGSYQLIARTFRWLTVSLFGYIGASFLAGPDWHQVLKGTLIATFSLDRDFITVLVAVLGTTISPYLFFWQASQEVEEEIAQGGKTISERKGSSERVLKYAAWDVNIGMFVSNLVMYFIILAAAATLHSAGRHDVATAGEAAQALRPLAGDMAFLLMALALIGTGVLAVPILTGSAAYAVAETFGWKSSLDDKVRNAKGFYLVIGLSTLVALLIDYRGINVMTALFGTAVINGFLSPPLLVIIMLMANNRAIMGKHVNGLILNVLGWTTTIVMFLAAMALVFLWSNS